jgi:hypothetical protein
VIARCRIGVLVPPGNPTIEPELYRMAPPGVSLHFARLDAGPAVGTGGAADGMEARTRAYLAGIERPARTLGEVKPAVVVLAHPASRALAWGGKGVGSGGDGAGQLVCKGAVEREALARDLEADGRVRCLPLTIAPRL